MLCLVTQSFLFETSWTVACQAPLSMGILQERMLEWFAMPSSRGSSWPRNWTGVSCITDRFFTSWATREKRFYSFLNQRWSSLRHSIGILLFFEIGYALHGERNPQFLYFYHLHIYTLSVFPLLFKFSLYIYIHTHTHANTHMHTHTHFLLFIVFHLKKF